MNKLALHLAKLALAPGFNLNYLTFAIFLTKVSSQLNDYTAYTRVLLIELIKYKIINIIQILFTNHTQ